MSTPSSPPPNADPQAARIALLEGELRWARLKIQSLEEALRLERIKHFGPKSENLNSLQLQLLTEEPSVTADEVEAESQREAITKPPAHERKRHPGRQTLPENLPRVERTLACPAEACQCPTCQQELAVIGYDESEVLDREPARYFVLVTKREKRACPHCQTGTVKTAPLPPRIIEKGLASDGIVVDTIVAKYCDHLPLYRQASILEREAGLEIGRATLDGWVMQVGESLEPVVAGIKKELLAGTYLQADETTVPVQLHDRRGSNHQAYLWQYGRPGGPTVFDFALGRDRAGPLRFLGQWNGILQTDGYQAYERVGGPGLVRVGCWAHCRRNFTDAFKRNPQDHEAEQMIIRLDALFEVDAEVRRQHASVEVRHQLRQEFARHWLAEIEQHCRRLAETVLPSSALGQAVAYTRSQWKRLARCLDYPEVELSNNLAENSMRPVAVGRKNWLHIGSKQAGPKVAAILSVVESCRRLKLPVKDYLADVLPGLASRTTREAERLTPSAWDAARR